MRFGKPLHAAAAAALVFSSTTALTGPAFAQGQSIRAKTEEKQAQIPTCTRRLGALAIRQPQNKWWEGLGLESPEAMLKILVQQSGCFTLVDRGAGFELAQQERALAAGGQLQGGANIGGGQIRAADYIMVPDIVTKNANGSGVNVGGLVGGFLGGFAGAIASSINVNSSTADVTLAMTNVRTTEQEIMTQGHGSKTDVGFGVGGGGFWGGFAGAGVSSYQKTAIGQVVVLAYIDAYTKLVTQMGGLSAAAPGGAAAAAPAQTLTMSRPGRMYASPDGASATVRQLTPGMALYPTGQTSGVWVEVSDEVGNKGWVPRNAVENAR